MTAPVAAVSLETAKQRLFEAAARFVLKEQLIQALWTWRPLEAPALEAPDEGELNAWASQQRRARGAAREPQSALAGLQDALVAYYLSPRCGVSEHASRKLSNEILHRFHVAFFRTMTLATWRRLLAAPTPQRSAPFSEVVAKLGNPFVAVNLVGAYARRIAHSTTPLERSGAPLFVAISTLHADKAGTGQFDRQRISEIMNA